MKIYKVNCEKCIKIKTNYVQWIYQKVLFLKKNTYTQDVQCHYCGTTNIANESSIKCHLRSNNPIIWRIKCRLFDDPGPLIWHTWCRVCGSIIILKAGLYKIVQERLMQKEGCFQFSFGYDKPVGDGGNTYLIY